MAKILKYSRTFAVMALSVLWAGFAYSGDATPVDQSQGMDRPPPPPVPAAEPDRISIPLYSDENIESREQWELFFGQLMVRNVTVPEIYPVLPDPNNSNGKAVLVLPGGGYQFVSMQNEGFPVAERLAKAGYSAFILKYRTRETPVDPEDFFAAAGKLFFSLGKARLPDHPPAVQDLIATVEYLKQNCSQYQCKGDQIHLIGASAGARTIIREIEDQHSDTAPDSVALIYPPMIDPIVAEPNFPLFLIIAQDDPLFKQGGFILPSAWVRAGGSLEFHLYNAGSHGFGAAPTGKTSQNWLEAYLAWLGEVSSAP